MLQCCTGSGGGEAGKVCNVVCCSAAQGVEMVKQGRCVMMVCCSVCAGSGDGEAGKVCNDGVLQCLCRESRW